MKRCKICGSYAFNLYKEDIDQGDLCDVHYWKEKALAQPEPLFKDLISRHEGLAEELAAIDSQPEQEPVAWWNKTHEIVSKVRWNDECEPLYLTIPQRKPQFKEFLNWAVACGYDTAHAHDGMKWVCLNPMTAYLWKAWQAALKRQKSDSLQEAKIALST